MSAIQFSKTIMPAEWGVFEVILAGWSESKNQPCAYHLRGYAEGGWPAFHVREVTRFRSPSDPAHIKFVFEPDNPGGSGLALVRMQREKKHPVILSNGHVSDVVYRVAAGFCQHTTVARDGIMMRILERWPDKIGEVANAGVAGIWSERTARN
jgi:hypothetical protein